MEVSTASRKSWVDGADAGTDTSTQGSFIQDVASIGRLSDASPASYWDSYLMEIITYNSALSDADRGDVETYLKAKWSI